MSTESLSLRFPHPRYDFVESPEHPPSTSNHDNAPRLNGHQPYANYAGSSHGPWAPSHDILYPDNLWYESPPSLAANLEGQYTRQTNPNIGYPPPRNAQHNFVPPGPSHGEYSTPPVHDIPDNGVRYHQPPMPGVTNESVPSGMSAMEGLKRLADRYLRDPGSQVDTLRMGLGPSGDRLRVVIVLDIDI